jgi:hypothetical protein
VSVGVSNTSLGNVSAAFTVPEVPPGTYHVMLCDVNCTKPLANIIPTPGFSVVADPATAEVAQRIDRFERRVRSQGQELNEVRTAAGLARVAARDGHSEIEHLRETVSSLADEAGGTPIWAFVGWLAAGGLAAALAALLMRRRGPGLQRSAQNASWHPSDDELQEVLSAEPTRRP